jgi:hypothetical protein
MLLTPYQISRISEKPFSRYLTVAILCSDLYMSSYDEFYQAMTLTLRYGMAYHSLTTLLHQHLVKKIEIH